MTKNAGVYARNSDGRFATGGPGGPGRMRRLAEREYVVALSDVVPLDRWRRIVERAANDAENGNHRAREWLSSYLCPPDEVAEILAAAERSDEPAKVVLLDWRRFPQSSINSTNGEENANN